MQDTAPQSETVWVVTRKFEESHTRVCGLLVTHDRSTSRAKTADSADYVDKITKLKET